MLPPFELDTGAPYDNTGDDLLSYVVNLSSTALAAESPTWDELFSLGLDSCVDGEPVRSDGIENSDCVISNATSTGSTSSLSPSLSGNEDDATATNSDVGQLHGSESTSPMNDERLLGIAPLLAQKDDVSNFPDSVAPVTEHPTSYVEVAVAPYELVHRRQPTAVLGPDAMEAGPSTLAASPTAPPQTTQFITYSTGSGSYASLHGQASQPTTPTLGTQAAGPSRKRKRTSPTSAATQLEPSTPALPATRNTHTAPSRKPARGKGRACIWPGCGFTDEPTEVWEHFKSAHDPSAAHPPIVRMCMCHWGGCQYTGTPEDVLAHWQKVHQPEQREDRALEKLDPTHRVKCQICVAMEAERVVEALKPQEMYRHVSAHWKASPMYVWCEPGRHWPRRDTTHGARNHFGICAEDAMEEHVRKYRRRAEGED